MLCHTYIYIYIYLVVREIAGNVFFTIWGKTIYFRFPIWNRKKNEARKSETNRSRVRKKIVCVDEARQPWWAGARFWSPPPPMGKITTSLCYICDLKARRLGGYFPAESSPAHQAGGCSGGGWPNPSTKKIEMPSTKKNRSRNRSERFRKMLCPKS